MLELLRDVNFFEILEAWDRELAEKVRREPCVKCQGPMHVANYSRKERGPAEAQKLPLSGIRLSFCCGDCRCRNTPPSVRYFGRRVYIEVVFVLASVASEVMRRLLGAEAEAPEVGTATPETREAPEEAPEVTAVPEVEKAEPEAGTTACEPEKAPAGAPPPEQAVPKRTVSRWKKWWREDFPRSSVWQAMQGRILPPAPPATLPGELLNRYSGSLRERVLRLLNLLTPLSARAPQAAPS